jgi:hypothetical protein
VGKNARAEEERQENLEGHRRPWTGRHIPWVMETSAVTGVQHHDIVILDSVVPLMSVLIKIHVLLSILLLKCPCLPLSRYC